MKPTKMTLEKVHALKGGQQMGSSEPPRPNKLKNLRSRARDKPTRTCISTTA